MKRNSLLLLFMTFVVINALSFCFVHYYDVSDKKALEKEKFGFYAINKGGIAPHTLIFHYEVSQLDDSVYISPEGKNKYYLDPEKLIFYYVFKEAGRYEPKIFTKNKVLKSIPITLNSTGWQLVIHGETQRYASFDNYTSKDILYVSPSFVESVDVDTSAKFYTSFNRYHDYKISADSMMFNASFKNNPLHGGHESQEVMITITGENESVCINFVSKYIPEYAKIKLAGKVIEGHQENLNFLARDFDEWNELKIVTKNDSVSIYDNKELLAKLKVHEKLGKLLGFKIGFSGCGQAKNISITDTEHNKVFHEFGI